MGDYRFIRYRPILAAFLVSNLGCGSPSTEETPRRGRDAKPPPPLTSSVGAGPEWIAYYTTGPGKSYADKRLRDIFKEQTASLFRSATRIESFRIADADGTSGIRSNRKVDRRLGTVAGYTITSNGRELGRDDAQVLAQYLLDGRRYVWASPSCFPDPGVAFRLWEGERSVALILCYECNYFDIFSFDEKGAEIERASAFYANPFEGADALVELAKKAFPDDREIQRLK